MIDIQTAIFGILGLSLMVSIHEFGHYLAARLCGIEVLTFSIGMGPRLFGFTRKGTDYRISAFPLGGYCRMKGEEDMQSALINNKETIEASPGSFHGAAPWKRIIVALAGPAANLLTALVLLVILAIPASVQSVSAPKVALLDDYPELVQTGHPFYSTIRNRESPAAKAGIKTGDIILSINGKEVSYFADAYTMLHQDPGKSHSVLLSRNGEMLTVQLSPIMSKADGALFSGIEALKDPVVGEASSRALEAGLQSGDRIIRINNKEVHNNLEATIAIRTSRGPISLAIERNGHSLDLTAYPLERNGVLVLGIDWQGIEIHQPGKNLGEALHYAFAYVGELGQNFLSIFTRLAGGMDPTAAVSGPIRSITVIGSITQQGMQAGLEVGLKTTARVIAVISILLCFGNLIPIPALDGGQIVLCIAEIIKRKPIRLKTIKIYNLVGLGMIAILLALALIGDFRSL